MGTTVPAYWITTFGPQYELRTYIPPTGLHVPKYNDFAYDLLGLAREQWHKGKHSGVFQAVFRAPPDSDQAWRDVTAPRGTPPQDYKNDLPTLNAAMALVEAKFRERNPDKTLIVLGDAPQITAKDAAPCN